MSVYTFWRVHDIHLKSSVTGGDYVIIHCCFWGVSFEAVWVILIWLIAVYEMLSTRTHTHTKSLICVKFVVSARVKLFSVRLISRFSVMARYVQKIWRTFGGDKNQDWDSGTRFMCVRLFAPFSLWDHLYLKNFTTNLHEICWMAFVWCTKDMSNSWGGSKSGILESDLKSRFFWTQINACMSLCLFLSV